MFFVGLAKNAYHDYLKITYIQTGEYFNMFKKYSPVFTDKLYVTIYN